MKTTELTASVRNTLGKRTTKYLRKEGRVPGVIYDNSNCTHISLDGKELRKVIFTADTYVVNLDVDGNRVDTIVRDVQFHPVKEYVQHVEFLKVSEDKPVVLTLPIILNGTPKGVITGGRLVTKLRKIKVKGVHSKLPENVEIDVSHLELGDTIKISDIEMEDIEVVTPLTTAVASVEIPRAVRSAQSEEEEGEGVEGEEGAEEGEAASEE